MARLDWDEGPFRQTERSERYAERLERAALARRRLLGHAPGRGGQAGEGGAGGAGYRGTPVPEGTQGAAVRLRVPGRGRDGRRRRDPRRVGVREPAARRLRDRARGPQRRSTTSPSPSTTPTWESRTWCAARTISPTRRASCWCWRRSAPSRPLYAHLPLLHGTDGKPLSKRHGAVSVQELRDVGYLPEAVRNYLALLGWGYDATTDLLHDRGADREVHAGARVALAGRLRRAEAALDERALHARDGRGRADRAALPSRWRARACPGADDPRLEQAVAAVQEKISTLAEFSRLVGFAFGPLEIDQKAWDKVMGKDGARGGAGRGARGAGGRGALRRAACRAGAARVVEERAPSPGAVFQPLRVAITGKTVSAGIFESLALLGTRGDAGADRRVPLARLARK